MMIERANSRMCPSRIVLGLCRSGCILHFSPFQTRLRSVLRHGSCAMYLVLVPRPTYLSLVEGLKVGLGTGTFGVVF